MSNENEKQLHEQRRNTLIANYRGVVKQLNGIEERLYTDNLNAKQNDELLTEYRNLSIRLSHLEAELNNDFGINTELL